MQIRTLSTSVKIKIEELRKLENGYSAFFSPYPLPQIIVSPTADRSKLAYYDTTSDCIIFQEDFIMNADQYWEKNVLLHELSHALQYKIDGITDHGESFHKYCRWLGVDPDFSKAKVLERSRKTESYARKVEKLLALTTSPYEEEAKSALLKAEELMAEHGLEYAFRNRDEDKLYYVILGEKGRFMQSEKQMYALVRNLTGTFLIYEELSREKKRKASLYGTLEQVETAVYLFGYLGDELERSVKKAKKEKSESFSKESFRLGLLTGLLSRMQSENSDAERALTLSSRKSMNIYKTITGLKITHRSNTTNLNSLSDYNRGMERSKDIRIPRKGDNQDGKKQIGFN